MIRNTLCFACIFLYGDDYGQKISNQHTREFTIALAPYVGSSCHEVDAVVAEEGAEEVGFSFQTFRLIQSFR